MYSQGYKTKKELAESLKISPSDLNNRTKSGTIKQLLIDLAIHKNVNTDWLLTGEGKMISWHGTGTTIAESQSQYRTNTESPQITMPDLISKAITILDSKSVYSTALKSNIEAFHTAITCHEELAVANKRIDHLDEEVAAIKERLPAIGE